MLTRSRPDNALGKFSVLFSFSPNEIAEKADLAKIAKF